jgi:spore maturation protein CgeB
MRILVCRPGPNWSVEDVANGWVRAFEKQGHSVINYDLGARLEFFGRAHILQDDGSYLKFSTEDEVITSAAVEQIGNMIYGWWPDIVVFVSGFWIPTDLLDCMRARGQKSVLIATESPYEDDRHAHLAPHCDLVLLNDPMNAERLKEYNPNTWYVPHSYDPQIHKPGRPDRRLRSDVCMVGTGYPSRVKFLEKVDWSGLDVALLGNWGAAADTVLAPYVRDYGCIDNTEAVRWYHATRSSVNLYRKESNDGEHADGWAMGPREVELAATGTFYLTEERGENREILPFIPTFTSPEDYREQLDWWLDHPTQRDRIIERAREAIADRTFDIRAEQLCQLLDKQPITI